MTHPPRAMPQAWCDRVGHSIHNKSASMNPMKTMKESQRKAIWMAERLFTAAAAVADVAVNDESFAAQARQLERQAHALVRAAGFPDKPTFELSAFCAQVCADYTAGKLEVLPFE